MLTRTAFVCSRCEQFKVWRLLNDEKDVWEGQALENRERLLPLEHSDLNDIESSVAQKRIRQVRLSFPR